MPLVTLREPVAPLVLAPEETLRGPLVPPAAFPVETLSDPPSATCPDAAVAPVLTLTDPLVA
jgi:hypothetical protein